MKLQVNQGPKQVRTRSKELLAEKEVARLYLSYHSHDGKIFIKKTDLNRKYGHSIATRVVSKYFILENRGNNLSGKINCYYTRNFAEMPEDRRFYIKQLAFDDSFATKILEKKPEEYNQKSVIQINKTNRNKAINWCIENNKLQYIEAVKLITSKAKWEIFYTEKSHRYFAVWPVYFSQMPSKIREMLVVGDSVDLENAIGQFIISELGDKLEKYQLVKGYLEDPKGFRKDIASSYEIEEHKIKRILHALLLGARVNIAMVSKGQGAINKINHNAAQNVALLNGLTEFIAQLKAVKKIIAKTNKMFSIKYFEWEQIAIMQVFKSLQSTSKTSFLPQALIMHDGIEGINLQQTNTNSIDTILYGSVYKFKVTKADPEMKKARIISPNMLSLC